MASNKAERLNEDIKRELISIVSQMKDPRLECFWTIMRVETSPDLTNAKVYMSVLESDEKCQAAIKALNKGHIPKAWRILQTLHPVFVICRL